MACIICKRDGLLPDRYTCTFCFNEHWKEVREIGYIVRSLQVPRDNVMDWDKFNSGVRYS